MPQFRNLNDLQKYMESMVVSSLQKIGLEVKDYLRVTLLNDWYKSYMPSHYDTTNMLIDSLTVSPVKKNGNAFEVEIYFNEHLITPVSSNEVGMFPSHMNITDGDSEYQGMSYGELLPIWIEEGQHSSIHSYTGIHMVERTIDWIKEDRYIKTRMKELLELKGYKCI
jgi:hypothetical protein